jgi:ketosteroid isomerase-like protein
VLAANKELDHQLLEGHRLLDTEKVMGLFTSSADIFFISPGGELHQGLDKVRQTWKEFFAALQSIHGEIDHVRYLPAGDGVIAFGQVTYHRQLKDGNPEQRLLYLLCFEHVDIGAYSIPSQTGLLIPSVYINYPPTQAETRDRGNLTLPPFDG